MIAVIQAHKHGAKIEYWEKELKRWDNAASPVWNFYDKDYRVKPEPLERWIFIYKDGREEVMNKTTVSLADGIVVHMREVKDE